MRRMILATAAGLLLVGAGVAVAKSLDGKAVRQASATFDATGASKLRTSTCTGADGSYTKSQATYTGTVTSTEPALNGPARISAASFVNTTTGDGTVRGELRIDTADGKHTSAHFQGVLTHGTVVGLAEGRTHPGRDELKLLANVSADYTPAGGFTNGRLGGATAPGDAVLVTSGGCKKAPKPPKPPKPEHVKAHGAITDVSSTSITVAGVTCAVPANLQPAVANLKTTDVVEIDCDVANGATTLKHVSKPRKSKK
jgi:hypothetical protein